MINIEEEEEKEEGEGRKQQQQQLSLYEDTTQQRQECTLWKLDNTVRNESEMEELRDL